MRRRTSLGLVAWATAALTGCATPPAPPAEAPGQRPWNGRLSLQIDSEPPQQFHAAFELSGGPNAGLLRLFSPLGAVLAQAHWSADGAWLDSPQGQHHYPDMAALTQALTGASLPLAPLFDWLTGQDHTVPGWQTDLSRHPQGRIDAQRTAPLPSARLRLILDPPP